MAQERRARPKQAPDDQRLVDRFRHDIGMLPAVLRDLQAVGERTYSIGAHGDLAEVVQPRLTSDGLTPDVESFAERVAAEVLERRLGARFGDELIGAHQAMDR